MSDTPSNLDPERLTDLEAQVVAEFESRTSEEAEAAAAAADEETAPAEQDGDTSVEAAVADGLDFVEPVEGAVSPSPAPEATSEDPDDAPTGSTPAEFDLPPDEWDAAKSIYEWSQTLAPEHVQAIDAVMSGEYTLIPTSDLPAIQAFYEQQNGQSAPESQATSPQASPQAVDDEDWEDLPPAVRETITALQSEVTRLSSTVDTATYADQLASTEQAVATAFDAWKAEHPYLDDEDLDLVQEAVVRSGDFPDLSAKHGPQVATQRLLDMALYSNPSLREKAITPQVTEQVAAEVEGIKEMQQRSARASAISGSSGIAGAPATPADPDDAMIEQIRQALQN